jgi:two-component system cit operon sensor histidine kinase CitA
MQKISAHSDASFIVIGDNKGQHLFHSVFADRVGTTLVGGDNEAVLQGKSTTTIRKGGLGISLRSKAPIFNAAGQVVGIVSVGYLTSYLDTITVSKVVNILIAAVLLLIALFIFSWFFTRSIKKQIFSLEPREIGLLVRQQKAMMESIYEGVIAIDDQRRIEVINQAARKLLGLSQPARELRGQLISQVIDPVPFFDTQTMLAKDTHDEICRFNDLTVIASRVHIMLEGSLQGWVITFRDRNEIDSLSAQLSQVKRYVDNLRIMRHEQLNRMTTLSGLLHMGRYEEAIGYIQAQSEHAQELLDFISSRFSSPTLCGLLLGKAARAREKGVELSFDPACRLDRPFLPLGEQELISIIGNLLDNAIEATQRSPLPHAPVEVLIKLSEQELIIEVADQGVGIKPEIRERIFERGITTKTRGDHGIGLYLIESYVTQAGGAIEVADNIPRGAIFSCLSRPREPPGNWKTPTMQHELIDVLIVEDENELAQLHAELISKHPRLRLVGIASSLAAAQAELASKQPQLVLLDNYLPDGKGISLINNPMLARANCSVIFITAASDMDTCSQAIRNGAFDYILKPVSWKRLSQSLERFVQFAEQQRVWKIVDQQNVDSLYQLQAKNYRQDNGSKGIEENTLARVQSLFNDKATHCFTVDEVVSETGLSKTTTRRYLEHCVEAGFLSVEMLYGKIGHPRRMYRRAEA